MNANEHHSGTGTMRGIAGQYKAAMIYRQAVFCTHCAAATSIFFSD